MTPEQSSLQSRLVAEVATHYGRLGPDGIVEIALVSTELAWALDKLRDHYLQLQSDELE